MSKSFATVRSRAPLRLGLAGGGSDISPYCDTYGGAVLNATIDRYATATLEWRSDGKVQFISQDGNISEDMEASAELATDKGLKLHRGVYNRMVKQYNKGEALPLTLSTLVESPIGSGLGSSSALVVAMIQAFAAVLHAPLGEYELAKLAFDIERVDLGLAGGKQDQYAAAFGGFNFLELTTRGLVIVNPLRIKPSVVWELEASLVLAFTGASRESASIIHTQTQAVAAGGKSLAAMNALKEEASAMKEALLFGKIQGMAAVLRKGWEAKKATSSAVSNAFIDQVVEDALQAGALAGKVSGAGGGGFLWFLVDPQKKAAVIACLAKHGLDAQTPRFTQDGCVTWEPKE